MKMAEGVGVIVDNVESLKPKSYLGFRHVQVLLLFFAIFLAFGMRVNMSIVIVAMTDVNKDNSFNWNVQIQSIILSSFFWGYIILQIPAGELARRFGGSILITIVIGTNAAISLLFPLAAYYGDWKAICACRALQGLCQGFLYPTMHSLICKWVPLEEKSRLGTFIYNGSDIGTVFQLLGSGFVANTWGWPAIFYINGTLGAIWTVAYVILGADSPQSSKMISDEERLYIQHSLNQVGEQKKLKTPWKAVRKSLPFYALLITQCGHVWGFWTLMTEMPSYMKKFLEVDIAANGVLSALPYFARYLLSFPFGILSDYSLKKKWVSISTARKISNTVSEWGPAIALIGLAYVPAENVTLAAVLLIIVVGLNAGHYTGFLIVHIDMAPNFAGTLMGISNTIANITSIITPIISGLILQDESDPNQWRKVFYVASAVYFIANLIFLVFGTSERQSWNEPVESCDEKLVRSLDVTPLRCKQFRLELSSN